MIIQARTSAVQAYINALSASSCEDVDIEGQIQLDIICIHMDTRQVVLNPVEDPRYIHDT